MLIDRHDIQIIKWNKLNDQNFVQNWNKFFVWIKFIFDWNKNINSQNKNIIRRDFYNHFGKVRFKLELFYFNFWRLIIFHDHLNIQTNVIKIMNEKYEP